MSAVIVLLTLRRQWSVGGGLSRLVALGTGTMLLALPYMLAIGGVTLKPSMRMASESQTSARGIDIPPAVHGLALFAMTFDPTSNISRELWVPIAIFKEASKTFHYGSMAFAVIGVGFAVRRLRTEPPEAQTHVREHLAVHQEVELVALRLKDLILRET